MSLMKRKLLLKKKKKKKKCFLCPFLKGIYRKRDLHKKERIYSHLSRKEIICSQAPAKKESTHKGKRNASMPLLKRDLLKKEKKTSSMPLLKRDLLKKEQIAPKRVY